MSDDITITLSRADAERLREALDYSVWTLVKTKRFDLLNDVKRLRSIFAAPAGGTSSLQKMQKTQAAPAEGPERAATGETPDSLERAIADAEAKGYSWRISGGPKPEYRQDARIAWEWAGGAGCKDCEGETPLAALRGALNGDGAATNWGETFPRKALRATGEETGA